MAAQGLNFFSAALTIQWSILVNNFFHQAWSGHWEKVHLSVQELIKGDFASGAVLITLGAVMGKVTKSQMVVLVFLEVIFYAVNESIGVLSFEAVDMGGSIFVHTFGAYFGLGVTAAMGVYNLSNAKTTRWNSLFSYIGTIFLFAFWPSFNGALAPNNTSSQHRVVINTVLSLAACCATTFVISKYVRHGKFEADDLLNATLAGGVGVGSSSDLVVQPGGAIGIGIVSGLVSTLGFAYLSSRLLKLGVQDVLGVHNLHGLPGLIGAIGGAISAAIADDEVYGDE
ncbi:rhbg [Symbiodinium sp. KB8]|nr:rhbg [Symbiodinium sp. KB8]